jgi:exonuclease III
MKFIGWNCQGPGTNLDTSPKMGYLSKLMYSTGAQVTFISEIRTSKYNSRQLNTRFNIADSFIVPSVGLSGGLWLLWNDEVQVTVKFCSFHLILASVVHIASGVDFLLVCVYGDPHHLQTKVIWDQISTFVHDNLGKPIVCLGDLNNIMSDVDTTSTKVNKSHMRAFNSYVKQCGLFDLGFSGPAYTWTNKHFSSAPVFERLDRGLANAEWCSLFPNTNVFNLPIMFGDHAPILVSTESKF